MESNNIKEYEAFKTFWRNKNNKNKEDNIYELIRKNDERVIQLLNSIWIFFHYNNIKSTIKKLKETSYENKRERNDFNKYMYTLEINIEQALEYFNNLLKNIRKIYEEKRDAYVLYVNNKTRKEENKYDSSSNELIKKTKFLLEEEEYQFDDIANDIIDNDYLKQIKKGNIDEKQDELFRNLEIVRICMCNTFKILGDLYRYKSTMQSESKKIDEIKSCTFYYKALHYVKKQGHTYNQCSLLYVNGDPIRCLYFYFLSLISMKPVENRESLVLFIERILREGRKLNDKTNPRDLPKRSRMKRKKAVEQISRTIHVICKRKGRYSDDETISKSSRIEHDEKKEEKKYEDNESNEELQYRKELCDALLNFYISYFKIVKMLFCKIDMNKFEKKKNKFIYYINKYVKMQYHNNKDDQVMLRNLIIIVFTLICIMLHLVIQEEQDKRTRGSFFYGNVQISTYVYKNEQIFFTLLLLYDILVSCKTFCESFYSHYLTIFVFLMYWIQHEKNMKSLDYTKLDCTEHEERVAFIKQYHVDYKKSSTYVLSKKGSSGRRKNVSLASGSLPEDTNLYYYDIIKSIREVIRSINFSNEEEEEFMDSKLLKYKLHEDYYAFPFLGTMKFEKIMNENKKTEKKDILDSNNNNNNNNNNNRVISNNSCYSLDERSSVGYGKYQEESLDSQDSNEDDIVLVKRPLFSKGKENLLSNSILAIEQKKKKEKEREKCIKKRESSMHEKKKEWDHFNKNNRNRHEEGNVDREENILEKNVLAESHDMNDCRINWGESKEDPAENVDTDFLNDSFKNSIYIYPSLLISDNAKLEERVRRARYKSLLNNKENDSNEFIMLTSALYTEAREKKPTIHHDTTGSVEKLESVPSGCNSLNNVNTQKKNEKKNNGSCSEVSDSVTSCKLALSTNKQNEEMGLENENESDSEESRYVDMGSEELDLFGESEPLSIKHENIKENNEVGKVQNLYETKKMNYMKGDPIIYQNTEQQLNNYIQTYQNGNKECTQNEKREENNVGSLYDFKIDIARRNTNNYFEAVMLNQQNINGTRVVKKENLTMEYKNNISGNIQPEYNKISSISNNGTNGKNIFTGIPDGREPIQINNMNDQLEIGFSPLSNGGICTNMRANNNIKERISNDFMDPSIRKCKEEMQALYYNYSDHVPINNELIYGYDEKSSLYKNISEEIIKMDRNWNESNILPTESKKENKINDSSIYDKMNQYNEYNTAGLNFLSPMNSNIHQTKNMLDINNIDNNIHSIRDTEENSVYRGNYQIPDYCSIGNNIMQKEPILGYYMPPLYNRIVLIDGVELGTCTLENGSHKFNIQRIDSALNYFKSRGYETHVLMPKEYFRNNITYGSVEYMRMLPNNPIKSNTTNDTTQMNVSHEKSILSSSDVLFFQHLYSLNFLIIQPFSVYYQYCVECIEKYNACIVMNSPFYEKNEYKMDVIWHELVEKYNLPEHFISYEFRNYEFIPDLNFRWPQWTWK